MKSVHIRSYSGPDFPALGLNIESYEVSLCIQSKCGKMTTRITLNTDIFYAVQDFREKTEVIEIMLLKLTRPKEKVVLFPAIGRVKIFYHPPARISRMCMRIYIFCFKKTHRHKQKIFQYQIYSYEFTFFPFKQ